MKAAFVTGATGFVGHNLVLELLARGDWHVTALHRASSDVSALAALPVERVIGSLDSAESLVAALPEQVDAIFHVAANTGMWKAREAEQYRDNVLGTRNLVEAALTRRARRFVHVSSQAAYGVHHGTFDERTPQRAGDSWICYDRTKFLAEEQVRAAVARGLDAVIVNPAHVLGPYDRDNWARMARMIQRGQLPGAPGGAGSFADVREVVKALVEAWDHGKCGENYLLGGTDARFLELITILGRLLERRVPKRAMPPFALKGYAQLLNTLSRFTDREPDLTPESAVHVTSSYFVNDEKAERELGYRAVPLEVVLTDMVTWMRSAGLLQ